MENALAALERLAELAEEAKLNTVAQELRGERIPTLQQGRLNIVVLGEFNHGKSTLINALLGGEVLPMGITPTTSVITRLVYAAVASAKVRHTDGVDEEVSLKRLAELVRTEDSTVQDIEVRYPSELLSAQVELIDTPGVNDISQQKVEISYGIVPRADIVLFVLDATQVLKHSELRFIEHRMLGGLRDRLIFVIGKIDRLEPSEAQEVISYANERLHALLGPVEIFPLSAREALRGDGDEGFDRLREHLQVFLRSQREQILLDSALGTGLRSGSALLGNLRIKRRGYSLARDELDLRVSAVKTKLQESQRVIAQNVERIDESTSGMGEASAMRITEFRDAFLAALPREIEKVGAEEVQRYLPDFIEWCFRSFLEREGRSLARSLEALAEEIITITNENLRDTLGALQEELGIDPDALNVTIDSTAYDVSVFALGAFGVSILLFINAIVGGLIALATPVVAFVIKDKLEARLKRRATEVGLKAIEDAARKAEAEMVGLIDDFGARLKQFIEDAGDRLYRQIDEALQVVLVERDAVGADRHALDRLAAKTEGAAKDVVDGLQRRREALWREERS